MVLDFINAHVWIVSISVVTLLFGARVIAKSEGPTLWPILPKWLDVTTWSEAGWSGRLAQVALTSVLAGGTVMAAALADGQLTETELKAAGMAILEAFGIYHGAKNLASGVKLPKASAKTTLPSIVLLALLLGGCAGSFEEAKLAGMDPQARAAAPPPTEHCISLDSQHRTWGGVAKVSAVVAGAEGLSSIPVDDQKVRIGLAAGTAAAAALAAGAAYVSEDAAASWARECSQ